MAGTDDQATLTRWAREHAAELRIRAGKIHGDLTAPSVRHIGARGIDFLRVHAPGSEFEQSSVQLFQKGFLLAPNALEALAQILEAWADHVDEGFAAAAPFAVQARVEAATDLMEQVQILLDDSKVHLAAPIVLAGAALEEFLRSKVIATPEAEVIGKPGINSYADALRKADVLSAQDVKDITAWAGQRNAAAHGQFDELIRPRALLMCDGVNLFMRQHTSPQAGP